MVITLSPSKTVDYSNPLVANELDDILFAGDSWLIIDELKRLSIEEIEQLMTISRELALLTYHRIQAWHHPFDRSKCQNAIYAFKGEAFTGFNVASIKNGELEKAQQQLVILSGLYGALRPLDPILPYRLEMATKLKTDRGNNLYQFWSDRITDYINGRIAHDSEGVLVNLAS